MLWQYCCTAAQPWPRRGTVAARNTIEPIYDDVCRFIRCTDMRAVAVTLAKQSVWLRMGPVKQPAACSCPRSTTCSPMATHNRVFWSTSDLNVQAPNGKLFNGKSLPLGTATNESMIPMPKQQVHKWCTALHKEVSARWCIIQASVQQVCHCWSLSGFSCSNIKHSCLHVQAKTSLLYTTPLSASNNHCRSISQTTTAHAHVMYMTPGPGPSHSTLHSLNTPPKPTPTPHRRTSYPAVSSLRSARSFSAAAFMAARNSKQLQGKGRLSAVACAKKGNLRKDLPLNPSQAATTWPNALLSACASAAAACSASLMLASSAGAAGPPMLWGPAACGAAPWRAAGSRQSSL